MNFGGGVPSLSRDAIGLYDITTCCDVMSFQTYPKYTDRYNINKHLTYKLQQSTEKAYNPIGVTPF
jgi:hypothetical protein